MQIIKRRQWMCLDDFFQVRLVVVDSVAFHFRHDFDDYALRTRLLNGLAQNFIKMATLNKLAVSSLSTFISIQVMCILICVLKILDFKIVWRGFIIYIPHICCIKSYLLAFHSTQVVLTNQMTTRIRPEGSSSGSHLTPALGESWGHASTIRVILFWKNQQRHALLYKSPSRAETVVAYQITVSG